MSPSVVEMTDQQVALQALQNGRRGGDLNLENLLLRDEDIFQTSLNSEDYLESLAPIIKDSLKANGLAQLISKLNNIVKDKDEELNDLSLNSTTDINSCISSIDNIHEDSAMLNQSLLHVSKSLNKSVHELIGKKKSLIKFKEVSSKIGETNTVLNLCLQVLEITNKSHDLIKQHKYFSALKLIDELLNLHLPKVSNFSFAKKIYDSIPLLTKTIQDESFENLGKWLAINLERKLLAIGEAVFDNIYSLQDHWDDYKKQRMSQIGSASVAASVTSAASVFTPHKVNSPIEMATRDPTLNYDILVDDSLQINLSVLYDVILVYQTIGEEELLVRLYNKEWLKKYNRIIYPITSNTHGNSNNTNNTNNTNNNLYNGNGNGSNGTTNRNTPTFPSFEALEEYLKKIAAFFIMDSRINRTTKYQLRTETSSQDLWESYCVKLKPVLLHFLELNCKANLDSVMIFKDLIGNFMQAVENHGYKIQELYEVMMIVFKDYFAPELIEQFRIEFLESIQSDHYMPLVVQDKQDYDNVMKICWYKPGASFAPNNVRQMPISFPFSEDYVHYCLGIRSLLEDIIQFISKHYGYKLNQLNDIILNDIFEKVLGEEKGSGISYDLRSFISKNSNNKEIISQSYTNLEYYLYSLYELGKLLNRRLKVYTGIGINTSESSVDSADSVGTGAFSLRAIDSLTKVRKFAEDGIFKMVDLKIHELLDMVEYDDWMPQHRNIEPNYSIKDFALFLENLFTSIFHNLPPTFRTLGLFRSYDFVAQHFLLMLKDVPQYNRIAIENFDLDVNHLEESMNKINADDLIIPDEYKKSGNATIDNGSVALKSTFSELRQCIDLLKLDNYDEFIKSQPFRTKYFERVKYEDGLKLIGKIYPQSGANNTPDLLSVQVESFSGTSSPARAGLPSNQLVLSTSTASKFAKFSSKFRMNNE